MNASPGRSSCSLSARQCLPLLVLGLFGCRAEPPPPAEALRPACDVPAVTGRLAIDEASGIAISRRTRGVLWVVNDGGANTLIAVDTAGQPLGTVNVAGAGKYDWEDLASAACGERTCLYIADIGDNLRERRTVVVHRVPEPLPDDRTTERATSFRFGYPDGAHDAEAIFVLPGEQLYVVTKGRSEPITVYRYPGALRADTLQTLVPVQQFSKTFVQLPDLITGGGATRDGRYIALRTYSGVQIYRLEGGFLVPQLEGAGLDLLPVREFQGEGVDLREDGVLFMASEKGLDDHQPPLSRAACRLTS